jgi:TRAP-type C4-dicarboxylate transport system substrate-binding protein
MKKLIIVFVIVAVCAACGGSSAVDKAVSRVEKALEKVEKNKGKMTGDDWKALEKELEEPLKVISDALEKDAVGMIGKMKILAVTAKWAATLTEAGMSELEKKTGVEREKWGQELEKAVKELDGDIGKEIEKAAQELQRIAAEK